MAIAPFVWALWQTRTGRVLICLFLLYLVIGLLGWWFIPVVLLLIGGVWLQNRQDEQKRKKEQDKLKEEYKRFLVMKIINHGNLRIRGNLLGIWLFQRSKWY